MSISSVLRAHWAGTSAEESGDEMRPKRSAEEVEEMIAGDIEILQGAIVEGIAKRATDGDVAAAEWLEARGLVTLPKPGEGLAPHEPPTLVGPGDPGYVPTER